MYTFLLSFHLKASTSLFLKAAISPFLIFFIHQGLWEALPVLPGGSAGQGSFKVEMSEKGQAGIIIIQVKVVAFPQQWVRQVPYNLSICAHVGRAVRGIELGISSFVYVERIQLSRGSVAEFIEFDPIFGPFAWNILLYSMPACEV